MKLKPVHKKLLLQDSVRRKIQRAHRSGESVVFTNGCFDLLHIGHIRSLAQARNLGDRLVVAINSDLSVRRLKGRSRPLIPLRQRMELVAALESVDWVVSFAGSTPLQLLKKLRPNILAKGGDWALHEIVGRAEIESWGGHVVRLRQISGARTSKMIDRIRSSA